MSFTRLAGGNRAAEREIYRLVLRAWDENTHAVADVTYSTITLLLPALVPRFCGCVFGPLKVLSSKHVKTHTKVAGSMQVLGK